MATLPPIIHLLLFTDDLIREKIFITASKSTTDQGIKAHKLVWRKKERSPLPCMGPLLKKRPNWLSQKKNRRPDTFVFPKTVFSGCRSNCEYKAYSSGKIKMNTSS